VRDFLIQKLGHTAIVVFCVLTLVFVAPPDDGLTTKQ